MSTTHGHDLTTHEGRRSWCEALAAALKPTRDLVDAEFPHELLEGLDDRWSVQSDDCQWSLHHGSGAAVDVYFINRSGGGSVCSIRFSIRRTYNKPNTVPERRSRSYVQLGDYDPRINQLYPASTDVHNPHRSPTQVASQLNKLLKAYLPAYLKAVAVYQGNVNAMEASWQTAHYINQRLNGASTHPQCREQWSGIIPGTRITAKGTASPDGSSLSLSNLPIGTVYAILTLVEHTLASQPEPTDPLPLAINHEYPTHHHPRTD